ncbi:hypothetical protein [Alkalicoccobacillus porphyridii]|uniref:Uncharacterized protein n=1 Tax=Alkalicoccobacillus porphyridii TaxID=2597270 RepID=A0A553ZXE6_9BACI|nr:hypothetical protein [Alkalicoccobacillus porphyridii]TSB46122.1 hypothetical protein FN960_12210 [Alkalicoccobacillus porphyridii]
MKLRWMISIFSFLLVVTLGLFIWGANVESSIDSAPELRGEFAQGNDGMYVFTAEVNGIDALYIRNEGADVSQIAVAEDDTVLHSPVVTNRNSVIYIQNNYGLIDQFQAENITVSSVIEVDLSTMEANVLVEGNAAILEVVSSKVSDQIYLIGSAGLSDPERNSEEPPNQFDLYSFNIDNEELNNLTDIGTYSMMSLVLDDSEEHALVIMPDDYNNTTQESMFEATETVYDIGLNDESEIEVVTDSEDEMLIADVICLPNDQLLLQSVINKDEDGNYIYDLIYYDRESGEEGEHLGIRETVLQPTLSSDGQTILYMKEESGFDGYEVSGFFEYSLERGEEREIKLLEKNE